MTMLGFVIYLLLSVLGPSSAGKTVSRHPIYTSHSVILHDVGFCFLDRLLLPQELEEENETCPSDIITHRQKLREGNSSTGPRCEGDGLPGHTFCVYTDTEFFYGRGITLITTPSTISGMNLSRAQDEYSSNYGNGDRNGTSNEPPYMERYIPGKGIGLVANRLIKRGETVILEPPSIIVHLDMGGITGEKRRLKMQWEGIYSLPPATRSKSLALMGHLGGDHLEDVLNTNAFGVGFGNGNAGDVDHRALFPQVSVSK